MNIVQQGAEAILIKRDGELIKKRIKKGYRLKELDDKLRRLRTKKEARLLEKTTKLIDVPLIKKVSEFEIEMEFIEGKKLSENLDSLKNWLEVCLKIGEGIAKLHDAGIIHGDLTTSNLIWVAENKNKKETKNFKEQLLKLRKLNLPTDEYAVFGSGPLAIRGIKDSNDLDIIVKSDLWDKLTKRYLPQDGQYAKFIRIGSIEIYKNWKPWFSDSDKLINDADIFDGVRFVKLNHVLSWKKEYNREKDKKDVQLIEEYQQKSGAEKLYFIDFGLGFESKKIEDKAVDLHLIKQALEAKHFLYFQSYWKEILEGYKTSKNYEEVLKRLESVEKRGRYKGKY